MIGSVEHFHAELQRLSFRDMEILDGGEIDVHLMRSSQIVAGAIAEGADQRIGEGRRIQEEIRRWIRKIRIHSGHAVEAGAGGTKLGTAGIPGRGIEGHAVLDRRDRAELPAAHDPVENTGAIQELLVVAERERVEDGSYEALRDVKGGVPVVAGAAMRVLGREFISGAANGAGIVERLRPGVTEQCG